MHLRDENHKPFDVEFETLGYVAIGLGVGDGGDELGPRALDGGVGSTG